MYSTGVCEQHAVIGDGMLRDKRENQTFQPKQEFADAKDQQEKNEKKKQQKKKQLGR